MQEKWIVIAESSKDYHRKQQHINGITQGYRSIAGNRKDKRWIVIGRHFKGSIGHIRINEIPGSWLTIVKDYYYQILSVPS